METEIKKLKDKGVSDAEKKVLDAVSTGMSDAQRSEFSSDPSVSIITESRYTKVAAPAVVTPRAAGPLRLGGANGQRRGGTPPAPAENRRQRQ